MRNFSPNGRIVNSALSYAALGWPVLPLHFPIEDECSCGTDCKHGRGKHPAEQFVPRGVLNATTDPRAIRSWWGAEPRANVGIRCVSFVVLDVDPRAGGDAALKDLVAVHGRIERTVTARTGSDGWHLLFRVPVGPDGKRLALRGKIVPGLDLKSKGGYIVAAPSLHVAGGWYRWVPGRGPGEVQLAEMPPWLLALAIREERPAPLPVDSSVSSLDRVRRAKLYAAKLEPAMSGQGGHTRTFLVCQRVARGFGLSEHEAYAALVEWNATCEPPWTERELRRKISEALQRGQVTGFGELLEKRR